MKVGNVFENEAKENSSLTRSILELSNCASFKALVHCMQNNKHCKMIFFALLYFKLSYAIGNGDL